MSRVHCIVIAVEKLIAYSRITSWAPDSSSEWKPVKKNTGATKLEFPSFQFAVEVQHRQLIRASIIRPTRQAKSWTRQKKFKLAGREYRREKEMGDSPDAD
jgi:hypothetical protein